MTQLSFRHLYHIFDQINLVFCYFEHFLIHFYWSFSEFFSQNNWSLETELGFELLLDPMEEFEWLLEEFNGFTGLVNSPVFEVEDFVGLLIQTKCQIKLQWNLIRMLGQQLQSQILTCLIISFPEICLGQEHFCFQVVWHEFLKDFLIKINREFVILLSYREMCLVQQWLV